MEPLIDRFPTWLKTTYVSLTQGIKTVLQFLGLLDKLDKKALTNARYHYVRSLLAIYQLPDMIQLDVPWWTYAAISHIDAHLQQKSGSIRVFEYGSGASTIWLAKRAHQVISVEHDPDWYDQIKRHANNYPHTQVWLKQPELIDNSGQYLSAKHAGSFKKYVEAIHENGELFDVIIIDGRSRSACLLHALRQLAPDGIIIFDNSDRLRYQAAIQASGLEIKRFPGIVPGSPLHSETAILFRNRRLPD